LTSLAPVVHYPEPIAIHYPDFDVDILGKDPPNLDFDFTTSTSHIRTPSRNLSIDTNPDIFGYDTENPKLFSWDTRPFQNDRISSEITTIAPPKPAVISSSSPALDYRKVNDSFEVKRGSKGLYVPLELPPLDLPPLKRGKSEPKKLQKRRPDSRY
jgi:hypothetical protein